MRPQRLGVGISHGLAVTLNDDARLLKSTCLPTHGLARSYFGILRDFDGVHVRGFNLSYLNQETTIFPTDPHCGNLNKIR